MPYPAESPYPSPYGTPRATKKRPGWIWFVVGGVLVAVAVVVAGVTLGRFGIDVARSDAVFDASGSHDVTVPAHTRRGVFLVESDPVPRCSITHADGSTVPLERPDSRFTYERWVAEAVFDTGDGTLHFECAGGVGARIRIAQVPDDSDFARVGIVGVLVPLAIGGAGLLVLLVTTILWITRRPQPPLALPDYYGPPPR